MSKGKRSAAPSQGGNVRSVMYASSPLLASKTPPWRSKFLVALVGGAFCVLLGRALFVQVIDAPFSWPRARPATHAPSSCPPAAAASPTAMA